VKLFLCGFQVTVPYLTIKPLSLWQCCLHPFARKEKQLMSPLKTLAPDRGIQTYANVLAIKAIRRVQLKNLSSPSYGKKEFRTVKEETEALLFGGYSGYCKLDHHLFRMGFHLDGLGDSCKTPEIVSDSFCPVHGTKRSEVLKKEVNNSTSISGLIQCNGTN